MKPRKAGARAMDAFHIDPNVVVVLSTRETLRGRIQDVQVDVDAIGPIGDRRPGSVSVSLVIDVQP
jgi:hypothetical protein